MVEAREAIARWHNACDSRIGAGAQEVAMNIRMQLVRAGMALAVIGGGAPAEPMSPPVVNTDCPFAKAVKPQRILLLDPIQKHPTWIDAQNDSSGDSEMHGAIDSKHGELLHGAVAS